MMWGIVPVSPWGCFHIRLPGQARVCACGLKLDICALAFDPIVLLAWELFRRYLGCSLSCVWSIEHLEYLCEWRVMFLSGL